MVMTNQTVYSSASCPELGGGSVDSQFNQQYSHSLPGIHWSSKTKQTKVRRRKEAHPVRFPSIEGFTPTGSVESLPTPIEKIENSKDVVDSLRTFERTNRYGDFKSLSKQELCALIEWDKQPPDYPGQLQFDAKKQSWLPAATRKIGCMTYTLQKLEESASETRLLSSQRNIGGNLYQLHLKLVGRQPVITAVNLDASSSDPLRKEWGLILTPNKQKNAGLPPPPESSSKGVAWNIWGNVVFDRLCFCQNGMGDLILAVGSATVQSTNGLPKSFDLTKTGASCRNTAAPAYEIPLSPRKVTSFFDSF